ncbi:MAG: hypothetical protein AAF849_21450 [Bacteroidota bacterium]
MYTSPSFWREYMNDTLDFTDYPLWLAHYTSRNQFLQNLISNFC